MRVREAGPDDAAEVIALWRATELTRPWNDPDTDFAQAIEGPTSSILLGCEQSGTEPDGRAVATAMVGVDGHRGWIYYLAVDPQAQGRGHGEQMLTASEQWLARHGARKVQLMVRNTNPVGDFYLHHGYTDQQTLVYGKWFTS